MEQDNVILIKIRTFLQSLKFDLRDIATFMLWFRKHAIMDPQTLHDLINNDFEQPYTVGALYGVVYMDMLRHVMILNSASSDYHAFFKTFSESGYVNRNDFVLRMKIGMFVSDEVSQMAGLDRRQIEQTFHLVRQYRQSFMRPELEFRHSEQFRNMCHLIQLSKQDGIIGQKHMTDILSVIGIDSISELESSVFVAVYCGFGVAIKPIERVECNDSGSYEISVSSICENKVFKAFFPTHHSPSHMNIFPADSNSNFQYRQNGISR